MEYLPRIILGIIAFWGITALLIFYSIYGIVSGDMEGAKNSFFEKSSALTKPLFDPAFKKLEEARDKLRQ